MQLRLTHPVLLSRCQALAKSPGIGAYHGRMSPSAFTEVDVRPRVCRQPENGGKIAQIGDHQPILNRSRSCSERMTTQKPSPNTGQTIRHLLRFSRYMTRSKPPSTLKNTRSGYSRKPPVKQLIQKWQCCWPSTIRRSNCDLELKRNIETRSRAAGAINSNA